MLGCAEKVEGLVAKLGFNQKKADDSDDDFKDQKAKHPIGLHSAALDGFQLSTFEQRLNSASSVISDLARSAGRPSMRQSGQCQ